MSEGTLWSTDLAALHIDTDANKGLWGTPSIPQEFLQADDRDAPGQAPGRRGVHLPPRSSDLHAVGDARTPIHCEAPDVASCEGVTALTVPNPAVPEWQQRTGIVPFASPHLGADGVRVTRSYPADSTIMMTSVTYHWHTPPGLPDVVLRGHHDDPEVIAAVMEALDDFARTLRLPATAH